jgi:hypothetical protein
MRGGERSAGRRGAVIGGVPLRPFSSVHVAWRDEEVNRRDCTDHQDAFPDTPLSTWCVVAERCRGLLSAQSCSTGLIVVECLRGWRAISGARIKMMFNARQRLAAMIGATCG